MRNGQKLTSREMTVTSVPSDHVIFDEERGTAKAVLHQDICYPKRNGGLSSSSV